ncbi:hypothetical protein HN51_012060 [Arachis hypogaea]|uniref:Protein BIG GRAIN 1-like B n=1 Tax=Arachis hypogaea TaxID=3818 RepID=A0A445DWE6_ARAHY|nr:protein BIG GRAIN 1-like B [Arachis hypogaea]QHO57491.1 Protein BIG GRAIN 1-like C [Arachis hypogaea]RYR67502.1 hypothetical protein Ahy_A03g013898 [Arachis hypogaea]
MEKEENLTYPQRKKTPSFSSTLLDAIYCSIDGSKSDLDNHQQVGHHHHHLNEEKTNPTTTMKHNHGGVGGGGGGGNNKNKNKNKKEKMMNNHLCRHAVMLNDEFSHQIFTNSVTSSASSECSYGVGATFSSSSSKQQRKKKNQKKQQKKKEKRAGDSDRFARSKLRALKMYGELNRKVKQPISPRSRIANFLCSIFNSGSVKKAKKMCYVGAVDDVNLTFQHKSKSPCFSSSSSTTTMAAASFSRRSCTSKTSSSSSSKAKNDNNNNNGDKRSVRFYPVSLILGENDSQQQRYSAYSEKDPSLFSLNVRKITRSSTSCIEARENHSSREGNDGKFEYISGYYGNCQDEDVDQDEDEDALSYSSSDLFELDHIICGAEGRYQEELPVYETTNLETNKAIANGLCS